jgi:hypothetical protein
MLSFQEKDFEIKLRRHHWNIEWNDRSIGTIEENSFVNKSGETKDYIK